MGISGLMIAGPLELFLPESIAAIVGGWVWLPLLTLYTLVMTLILLLARPRLVIYNISPDHLRPILKEISHELDSHARWAGDSVALPELGIALAIDCQPGIRNVTLASVGAEQNLDGWALIRATAGRVPSRKSATLKRPRCQFSCAVDHPDRFGCVFPFYWPSRNCPGISSDVEDIIPQQFFARFEACFSAIVGYTLGPHGDTLSSFV